MRVTAGSAWNTVPKLNRNNYMQLIRYTIVGLTDEPVVMKLHRSIFIPNKNYKRGSLEKLIAALNSTGVNFK